MGSRRRRAGGQAEWEEEATYKGMGTVSDTHPYTEPYGPENIIIVLARHCPTPLPCISVSMAHRDPARCCYYPHFTDKETEAQSI